MQSININRTTHKIFTFLTQLLKNKMIYKIKLIILENNYDNNKKKNRIF